MDSLTHIVLGACAGELLLGKKIGKKALVLGAAAQSLPDIDFVASLWLGPTEDLIAHRGITHSILFAVLISPLLGFVISRTINPPVSAKKWTAFFLVEIFIHLFIDAFNNYGIGWFEPFSDWRISFNAIYVADPLMTIFPLIATFVLIIKPGKNLARRRWARVALVLSSIYLCICVWNKTTIDAQSRKAFAAQDISAENYFTTPAPLQSMLWMVVAGDTAGYHVGYRSILDKEQQIDFSYFPKNDQLLEIMGPHEEIINLKKFSKGFYTVEEWGDTLVFNDLRFGQIIGWHNPKEKFVFHYFLQHPESNALIVQRGRFARWDRNVINSFWRRMWGGN